MSWVTALAGASERVVTALPWASTPQRQTATLKRLGHRPWPLPHRPWLMGQTWRSLLFMHWPVPAETLARVVPPELDLDQHDGSSWIGVSPFVVEGARLRGSPALPFLSSFPEVNVRTYVTVGGKPGIYFLSLDASQRSAVFAARRGYRLPYFRARIESRGSGRETHFTSTRRSADGPPAEFRVSYGPTGEVRPAPPGSLEYFLVERYCLYTLDERRQIWRGEIHHPPWPLQVAQAAIARNSMTAQIGVSLGDSPLCHFADRQDVVLWRIERV